MAALGLGPLLVASGAGCAVRSLDDPRDDMGHAEDDDESGGSTGTDPTTGAVSITVSGSGSADGTSSATIISSSEDDGTDEVDGSDDGTVQYCVPSGDWLEWEFWLPLGPTGECVCDEECQAIALAQWNEANCCDSCWYAFGEIHCAEPQEDRCHYIVSMRADGCGEGRPLLVDGRTRTAGAHERDDWSEAPALPRMEGLSPAQRRVLTDRWTRAALAEHASVASFARFALDLAALGAPPELLANTAAAMQDEIRHAQLAFAFASAYAGKPVGPGPLPMHGVTAGGGAETIVRAAVREGCVEETLGAAEAELAAHRATDPAVRAVLTAIADDEARHAVLAWRFVDWAVRRNPSLATAVRDELLQALAAATSDSDAVPATPTPDDDASSAHGIVPQVQRLRLRAHCLRSTIRPCAAAMLHGHARMTTASV